MIIRFKKESNYAIVTSGQITQMIPAKDEVVVKTPITTDRVIVQMGTIRMDFSLDNEIYIQDELFSGTREEFARELLSQVFTGTVASGGAEDVEELKNKTIDGSNNTLQNIPQSAVKLPVDSRLVYVGDSITSQGFNTFNIDTGTAANNSNNGFVNYANILAGSRFFVPPGGNKGVAGDGTQAIIERLGAILALKPAVVILEVGTNDISADIAIATIEANYRTIINALKAINAQVISVTVLQRFGANALTSPQETTRQTFNTWLKQQPDIIVVDGESLNSSSYFSDGLHPNVPGAYLLGSLIAAKLSNLITANNIADTLFADNTYNDYPHFTGTGGSKNTATGTVANGWQLASNNAGGATVVGSKSTEDKQVVTISGTYSGNSKLIQLSASKTVSVSSGDIIEGICDIEIVSALTGIASIDVVVAAYNESYSTAYANMQALYVSETDKDCPLPVGRYTIRTPAYKLTGVPDNYNLFININFKNAALSSAAAGEIKVWRAAIRKIQQ
jgi:lysophospholipase L1-like esterase